jgi:hypothetical protein
MAVRYRPEVHDFIRTHLEQFTIREMAEEINQRFGTNFNYDKMKGYYANHKLKSQKREKVQSKTWPEEVVNVLLKNYKGRSWAEMQEILLEKTGREYTIGQIKGYYANHKLNSGLNGRFEPGHVPWTKGKKWSEYMSEEAQQRSRQTCFDHASIPDNLAPVGTIRKSGGYLIKKVQERGSQWERWKFLHRIVWEENFGPIPEGMVVGFKDNDKMNCDPGNLILMSLDENARMNQKGYRSQDPDLTQAGLLTVRLEKAIREKKKEDNNGV